MSNLFNKFSLDSVKFNEQVLACAAIIWLVVLITALSSIFSQPFSKKQRIFWTLVVGALPIIGLLVYLPFSVKHEEYPLLFNWKSKK